MRKKAIYSVNYDKDALRLPPVYFEYSLFPFAVNVSLSFTPTSGYLPIRFLDIKYPLSIIFHKKLGNLEVGIGKFLKTRLNVLEIECISLKISKYEELSASTLIFFG